MKFLIIISFALMSFGLKYKMDWKTTEDQLVMIRIFDALAGEPAARPYNIRSFGGVLEENQLWGFSWDALPGDATGVTISYYIDGTATSGSQSFGTASPVSVTVPFGNWHFYFTIHRPGGDEVIDMLPEDAQVVTLDPSDVGLELSVVDADEDLHKVIRAKQAVLKFLSTNNYAMSLFARGRSFDYRWYVTAELNLPGRFLFKGYLILDDLGEPFLAPRKEVVLTATDRMGTLKTAALVDFENANPRGYNTIAKYIAWALRKTGLSLPINVVMNIKEESSAPIVTSALFDTINNTISVPFAPFWQAGKKIKITGSTSNDQALYILNVLNVGFGYLVYVDRDLVNEDAGGVLFEDVGGHLFNKIFIEAKTWETAINESENSSVVIEKLLGEGCFITQEKGEWWIVRLDETDISQQLRVSVFDADGNFVIDSDPITLTKMIGRNDAVSFVHKNTVVNLTRPVKHVRLTYRYDMPELLCNKDFSRGELVDGSNPLSKTYTIECWQKRRGLPGNYFSPITINAFIKKIFNDNDYEKERYIYITPQTGHAGFSSADDEYIESEAIPVLQKDKFTASIDWRIGDNIPASAGGFRLFRFVLHGNDGSWWILGWTDFFNDQSKPKWWDTANWIQYTAAGETSIVFGNQDEREWNTISLEAPPAPVSGKLYCWINQFYHTNTAGVNGIVDYANLQFDYLPLINGSYRKYTGQEQKVTQVDDAEEYNATRDKQVYMSDAPNPNCKGAMHVLSGYAELYSGPVTFGAPNGFNVPGDVVQTYMKHMKLRIISEGVNYLYTTVVSAVYHVIGDSTEVTVDGSIAGEIENAVISEAVFSLANRFYNANAFPGVNVDDQYFHPYGEIQVYDVFNQYNRVMRKYRDVLHGLSAATLDALGRADVPGLVHRYLVNDSSEHARNKNFQMMSFRQDFENCEWSGVMREVNDITKGKVYVGREFKYVEK